MLVLTVDPGLRGCGCAWWEGKAPPGGGPRTWTLLRAAYVAALAHEPEDGRDEGAVAWMAMVGAVAAETRRVLAEATGYTSAHGLGLGPDVVAVEAMRVYARGKGDPADLVALAAIAGGILASFPSARHVALRASEWKGQVPRSIMGERVVAKLRGERPLPPGATAPWSAVDAWTAREKDRLNDAAHAAGLGLYLFERARL